MKSQTLYVTLTPPSELCSLPWDFELSDVSEDGFRLQRPLRSNSSRVLSDDGKRDTLKLVGCQCVHL